MPQPRRAHIFCPFCNCQDQRQPILSPLCCVYVLGRGSSPRKPPPPGSHYEYRCGRCGYIEIQQEMLTEGGFETEAPR